MRRVYAAALFAQMVERQALEDRSDALLVFDPMSKLHAPAIADDAVAIAVPRELPDPALSLVAELDDGVAIWPATMVAPKEATWLPLEDAPSAFASVG